MWRAFDGVKLPAFAHTVLAAVRELVEGSACWDTAAHCSTHAAPIGGHVNILPDESRPRAGFNPAETLVQNGTAGDNDTAGGTLVQKS